MRKIFLWQLRNGRGNTKKHKVEDCKLKIRRWDGMSGWRAGCIFVFFLGRQKGKPAQAHIRRCARWAKADIHATHCQMKRQNSVATIERRFDERTYKEASRAKLSTRQALLTWGVGNWQAGQQTKRKPRQIWLSWRRTKWRPSDV